MSGVSFRLILRARAAAEANDQLPKFSRALTAHQQGYEVLLVIVTLSFRGDDPRTPVCPLRCSP